MTGRRHRVDRAFGGDASRPGDRMKAVLRMTDLTDGQARVLALLAFHDAPPYGANISAETISAGTRKSRAQVFKTLRELEGLRRLKRVRTKTANRYEIDYSDRPQKADGEAHRQQIADGLDSHTVCKKDATPSAKSRHEPVEPEEHASAPPSALACSRPESKSTSASDGGAAPAPRLEGATARAAPEPAPKRRTPRERLALAMERGNRDGPAAVRRAAFGTLAQCLKWAAALPDGEVSALVAMDPFDRRQALRRIRGALPEGD